MTRRLTDVSLRAASAHNPQTVNNMARHDNLSRKATEKAIGGIGPGEYDVRHFVEKRDRAKRREQAKKEARAYLKGKASGYSEGYRHGVNIGRMKNGTEDAIRELAGSDWRQLVNLDDGEEG